MSLKKKKRGIFLLITAAIITVIVIVMISSSSHDEDDGHNHEGQEILTITNDFVTEYNRVSEKDKITIDELRNKNKNEIKVYEKVIKEKTGYDMRYNDSYCNFDTDLYEYYYTSNADIDCYYGNDEGAIYFTKYRDILKDSYNTVTSYYDYDILINYITDTNEAISSVSSLYWKLFLILNSHPVVQADYFEGNTLSATYPIMDFAIIEKNTEGGNQYGKIEYRYDISDVLTGQLTKEEGTVLMNINFDYVDGELKLYNNTVTGSYNAEYVTTTTKDWIEYRNDNI